MRLLICFILLAGWFPWKGMQPTRSQTRPVTAAASTSAYLEFAPTSGTGLGTACACADITGSNGETLTYQRQYTAFCSTVGASMTGITNGSLISCGANKPRVQPGTDGVLGVLSEPQSTNAQTYSEDVSQWTLYHDGAADADPVVTVNQAVAPDGTTTADKVDFPASGPVDGRSIFYREADTSQTKTASVYLKGVSGSGSTDMTFTGATPVFTVCTFNATTWTRCSLTAPSTITGQLEIGPNTVRTGNTYAATSVYVWGIQQERGPSVTSYVKTVASADFRAGDKMYFTIADGVVPKCMGINVDWPNGLATKNVTITALLLYGGSNSNYYDIALTSNNASTSTVRGITYAGGVNASMTSSGTVAQNTNSRVVQTMVDSTHVGITIDGTLNSSSVTSYTAFTTSSHKLYVGYDSGGDTGVSGVVSRVKLDTTVSGCQ